LSAGSFEAAAGRSGVLSAQEGRHGRKGDGINEPVSVRGTVSTKDGGSSSFGQKQAWYLLEEVLGSWNRTTA